MTPIQPSTLLVKAKEIAKEVQDSCTTTHSILNRITEQGPLHLRQLEDQHQKLGSRFIELLHHSVSRKRVAMACNTATETLTSLKHPFTARKLATLKFGFGECDEMAAAVALKTARVAPCHLVISSPKEWGMNNAFPCNLHAFVLWGVDDDDLTKQINRNHCEILKTIRSLSGGILIDPFLGIVCHTREIETKGKDLLEYSKIWGTDCITRSFYSTPDDCPKEDLIEEDARAVYDLALTLLPQADDPDNKIICQFLGKNMARALEKDDPETIWKSTYKEGCPHLWTQGTKDKIALIAENLTQRGIEFKSSQVKGSEEHALIIKNPDPMVVMGLKRNHPIPEAKQD